MKTETKTLYLCGVDWQHEIGETSGRLYTDLAQFKRMNPCWKRCGIVEIKAEANWIAPQRLGRGKKIVTDSVIWNLRALKTKKLINQWENESLDKQIAKIESKIPTHFRRKK